jgi:hypothetical protein
MDLLAVDLLSLNRILFPDSDYGVFWLRKPCARAWLWQSAPDYGKKALVQRPSI